MATCRLLFKASVEKDLRAGPQQRREKVLQLIAALRDDPRPPGSERLTGQGRYRLRQGRYRIVYTVQDKDVTVWAVRAGRRSRA